MSLNIGEIKALYQRIQQFQTFGRIDCFLSGYRLHGPILRLRTLADWFNFWFVVSFTDRQYQPTGLICGVTRFSDKQYQLTGLTEERERQREIERGRKRERERERERDRETERQRERGNE